MVQIQDGSLNLSRLVEVCLRSLRGVLVEDEMSGISVCYGWADL